jgi:hypothetical protein
MLKVGFYLLIFYFNIDVLLILGWLLLQQGVETIYVLYDIDEETYDTHIRFDGSMFVAMNLIPLERG